MKRRPDTESMDRRMEATLGNLLRTGVIIAGSVVLIGAVLFLVRHGSEISDYHIFKPESFDM